MTVKPFQLLWVIFALLDPDSESGSTNPIESGSATLDTVTQTAKSEIILPSKLFIGSNIFLWTTGFNSYQKILL